MRRIFVTTLLATLAIPLAVNSAPAETFVLASGARLEGKWLTPDQDYRQACAIELASGAKLAFTKNQVTRVIAPSVGETQYETILPKMPDTVEGHWTMAEWCARSNLPALREFHLQTIIEREPQHEKARLALGYVNFDGKWTLPDEHQKSLGLVKYRGTWRTPQEVAILTSRAASIETDRKWRNDVKLWHGWLNRPSKAAEGLANLQAIRDPNAAAAIADLLDDKTAPSQLKLIYAEILGRMANNSGLARGALVNHVLYDDLAEVREKCLDLLENCDRQAVAKMFVVALDDKNNKVVNRAAVGIARMEDKSAILPLINHLITEHKFVVVKGGGGNLGASFGGGPGAGGLGGLSAGGGGPQQIESKLNNESVLTALVALTGGQNLGYDQDAWKKWYAESQSPREFDLRRKR